MRIAHERLVVPLLALVPNHAPEPCALEPASGRGTFVDKPPPLACGLHEALVDRAAMQCEPSGPRRDTGRAHVGLRLVVLEPLFGLDVVVETRTEFVLGLVVGCLVDQGCGA